MQVVQGYDVSLGRFFIALRNEDGEEQYLSESTNPNKNAAKTISNFLNIPLVEE
jgi:hypothetical protein